MYIYICIITSVRLTQSLPIAFITDKEAAKEFGVTFPSVLLLKDFDEKRAVLPLDENTNSSSVVNFITNERYPRVVKFTPANNKW